jgi:hypothetical protein
MQGALQRPVNLKRHMVYLKDFKEESRNRAVPPLCSSYSQEDVADLLNKNREEIDGLSVFSETYSENPIFNFNAEGYLLMDKVAVKIKLKK